MVLSGLAMVVVGVWLTLQAIGGNLAGRIRAAAGNAIGGGGDDAPRQIGGDRIRALNICAKAGWKGDDLTACADRVQRGGAPGRPGGSGGERISGGGPR